MDGSLKTWASRELAKMSIRVEISEDRQYLIGTVEGPLTRETAQQLTSAYVDLISSTGIKRILNDVRKSKGVMGVVNDRQFAYKDAPRLELHRDVRAAIVAAQGDRSHYFQETVARNAGYSVKVFHEFEPAIAWLLVQGD